MTCVISKESLKRAFKKLSDMERFHHQEKGRFVLCKLVYKGIGEGTEWDTDYQDEGIEELYKLLKGDQK